MLKQYEEYQEKLSKLENLEETSLWYDEVAKRDMQRFALIEKIKLKKEYEVVIEANSSWDQFSKIQPHSGEVKGDLLDIYLKEASQFALDRALMIRVMEDKGLIKHKISNQGIKLWRDLTDFLEYQYQALLRLCFEDSQYIYRHFFDQSIFDWYLKTNSELGMVVEKVLFMLNSFDFSDVDHDILSRLYQEFFNPEERKRLGQFYTPPEVIRYLLKQVGWPGEGYLLDFSCGSGGFLIEALRQLLEEGRRKNLSPESVWEQARRIVGFEINPFAAHIAEINLLSLLFDTFYQLVRQKKEQKVPPRIPDLNVFWVDALQKEDPRFLAQPNSRFSTSARFWEAVQFRDHKTYRFVVGNPPYVRNERLDENIRSRYS
ncbi:MAG: N-6 DNA methylase, partial [Candidatus Bathyarchaeia archaeon]